jgi:ketosteroid isomerase-like protein
VNDLEISMATMFEVYRAAVFERNVDDLMQLYDPGVRVFDTWGVWSYEGAPAWREMVEQWFSSLGAERVKVTVEDVKVTGGKGFAVVSAIVTFAGLSAEGAELRSMQNRLTWGLKPVGKAWKIVHEHTSVPIDFDHAKAILHRAR